MTINLNEQVSFELTPVGAKILNVYEDTSIRKAGDRVKLQLWSFANIFGPHLQIGFGEVPIKNLELAYEPELVLPTHSET